MPITPVKIKEWLTLIFEFINFIKINKNNTKKQIKAVLKRTEQNKKQTLGELHIFKGYKEIFTCKTLELTWKNNQTNVSCIPYGCHAIRSTFSPKENRVRHEIIVKNRSGIRFDTANYFYQLKGCIALGNEHTDINNDGLRDVTNSKKTIEKFEKIAPDNFYIEII